eukprot:TRINITY_DN1181_c0_g3_i1.p1 TRINITY_DN1181_c0_g3~~TRINITY_DN1181_c0_g3_i1.p1  ORF type:complete len:484 (-),score=99.47 TRINITY_DN1181_c0_g3_i1:65-1516(-)
MAKFDLSLYLVTSSEIAKAAGHTLEDVVKHAIDNGVTLVQLREKKMETKAFIDLGRSILSITKQASIPLIINDRIDVALAIGADGVHLGLDDMPVSIARKLLGDNAIIGFTVSNAEQAIQFQSSEKIDYFGTDAIFSTDTKTDKQAIGLDVFNEITSVSKLPVVAIGGIKVDNVHKVINCGAKGIAVVSAICGAENVAETTKSLSDSVRNALNTSPYTIKVANALRKIKNEKPLVHQITNYVVMNITANATLASGALPVMAHAEEEVQDMVKIAKALVINLGTLDKNWVSSCHQAIKAANEKKIPVVLDPVGSGATPYRTHTNTDILNKYHIDIVKGNSGEIGSLAGENVEVRGVESVTGVSNPNKVITELAKKHKNVIVITGKRDLVSDGKTIIGVDNGHPNLGLVTGMGCVSAALIGAFASVESDHLVAALGGLALLEIAAERAAKNPQVGGPATFQLYLFDELSKITPAILASEARFVQL